MEIRLNNIGKKFNKEWIFRNVNLEFKKNKSYALTGPNGSGKSTLLQVIGGFIPPNSGHVEYLVNNRKIDDQFFYQYIVIAAPYLELIEEYTLKEFLTFHFRFKKIKPGYSIQQIIESMRLKKASDKIIKNFSSGMKQRVKLGLAFFSDAPVILIDEPTTNLDEQGVHWFLDHMNKLKSNRLILMCSNQVSEYSLCEHKINLMDFKK